MTSKPAANGHLIAQWRVTTPLGSMTAACSRLGLSGLWFDAQRHHPGELGLPGPGPGEQALVAQLASLLAAYFAAQVLPEASLPVLDPAGTPFQRAVWQALRQIPAGQVCSYGQLAASLGRPAAVRAVGAAVGRNPISLLIPCHRVLGADGGLTGYAGGLARKQALLDLETRRLPAAA